MLHGARLASHRTGWNVSKIAQQAGQHPPEDAGRPAQLVMTKVGNTVGLKNNFSRRHGTRIVVCLDAGREPQHGLKNNFGKKLVRLGIGKFRHAKLGLLLRVDFAIQIRKKDILAMRMHVTELAQCQILYIADWDAPQTQKAAWEIS